MNKISDEEINNILNEKWEYIKSNSKIDERKLMGIFAIGKACYDFVYTLDDIELICYYIPSFEELCLNVFRFQYCEKFNGVKMIDFRYAYNLLLEQDRIPMEATFTNFKMLNDIYKQGFEKYILMNKEILFHYDNEKRVYNATQRALKKIVADWITDENGFMIPDILYEVEDLSKDELFEICRIRIACELLLGGTSVENCINLKKDYHINYLTDVLEGKIKPNLCDLVEDLLELQKRAESCISIESTKDLFQELLFHMYTVGLTKKREFIKILTKTEQEAFEIIKNHLENGVGYISISQLIENSSISRPVFKNTLQKMTDSKVAEIENKGVKGTYIKIIDSTILG